MDRRSWPWHKKSSSQSGVDIFDSVAEPVSVPASDTIEGDRESYKKPNYVQTSMDQVKKYEDHIKNLEEEVKTLNEQLSEARSEINQFAKFSEEAVTGWEKVEKEATMLKNQLESVTLLKLTYEHRASHLDGALKECMRQIRNLKIEHEQTVHDVVLEKTKQFEKMKLEFDSKLANLDQDLMRSAAENADVSRSLHDRSNMLMKVTEEKSRAEAENEV